MKGLEAIQGLSLELVKQDLMDKEKGPGFSEERADKAIEDYKAFLERHLLLPDNDDNPTLDADQAWHAHILHTRDYFSACEAIFGEYLHHFACKPVPVHLDPAAHALCGTGGGTCCSAKVHSTVFSLV